MSISAAIEHLRPGVDFVHSVIVQDDGDGPYIAQWNDPRPQPSQAEIDGAMLPGAQAVKLAQIRADAKVQIESQYPAWRQTNAALGLLPQAYVDTMNAHITAVIAASNTAENAVAAATTIADVDGVTPVWP